MMTIEELLLKTLDDLSREKLERFKWHLKKNHSSISVADLETANAFNTVDKMVSRFTPEGAVKNTLDILRKMNENHLARELEKDVSVRNAVQMSSDGQSVHSGITVSAPVSTTNVCSSPATFSSSAGAFSLWKKADAIVKLSSTGMKTQYGRSLTLDTNTAHPNLLLSEENRTARHVREKQPYPDHPERFDWQPQVLSKESLTGRCYWEAEWSASMWADIVVTYKGTRCKGVNNDYKFGQNNRSWQLKCSHHGYAIWHNNCMTNVRTPARSNRVGVYVDMSAGTLSFYSVSHTHTLTHLHTFNTTFTEPLYAGFGVHPGSSVSLCVISQPLDT